MARVWAISFGESERMALERIMMDEDPELAMDFVRDVVYRQVKEIEKPGACFHDVDKPVDGVGREVNRHKRLGTFD